MTARMTAVLGVLALALGLANPANAANSVDITYDLSDTIFLNEIQDCADSPNSCVAAQLFSSSMNIRYTSNSASSMPILSGPATLKSLTMSAHIGLVNTLSPYDALTTANLHISLISPVAGNLLSGGTLTFGSAQLRVTGSRHCDGFPGGTLTICIAIGGVITSVVGPLGPYTTVAAGLTFAAPAGPYGGAQSTRHTVSGTAPVKAPSKIINTHASFQFASGLNILGREILREAEGHDPKITPEPGTLLLLGAGTAGLVLVSRVTRRSQQG